jgi:hypothetical protein
MRPEKSTAVQDQGEGQEMAVRPPPWRSMSWGVVQAWPFQVRVWPSPSTAAQNRAVGHDTDVSAPPSGSAGLVADHTGRDHEVPFQVNA